MVKIDKQSFQLVWTDKGLPDFRNKSWSVRIAEFVDDRKRQGAKMSAKFSFERVAHINVQFEASDPKSFSFFPPEIASDFKVNVTCWSPSCPGYIKQNAYSIYTEITNERVVNKTYVYFVEATQLSQVNITKYTVSFNITKSPEADSKVAVINITGDFWDWYAANKNILPFYAPPPITKDPAQIADQSLGLVKDNQGPSKTVKGKKVSADKVTKTEL